MLRKLVCLIVFLMSTSIIALYVKSVDDVLSLVDLADLFGSGVSITSLLNDPISLGILNLAIHSIVDVFGIPVLLFVTSLIGLTVPTKIKHAN